MGRKRNKSDAAITTTKKPKPLVFRSSANASLVTDSAAAASSNVNGANRLAHYPGAAERSMLIRAVQDEIELLLSENQKLKIECNDWHHKYFRAKHNALSALLTIQNSIYNTQPIAPQFAVEDIYSIAESNLDHLKIDANLSYVIILSKLQSQRDNLLRENKFLKTHANTLYHNFQCTRLNIWNLLTQAQDCILSYMPNINEPLPAMPTCQYPYPELVVTNSSVCSAGVPIFSRAYYSTYPLPEFGSGSQPRVIAAAATSTTTDSAAPLRFHQKLRNRAATPFG